MINQAEEMNDFDSQFDQKPAKPSNNKSSKSKKQQEDDDGIQF